MVTDLTEKIKIVWHVDDILMRAEDKGIDLPKDKALTILHDLKDNHDSTIGINWEVIDFYIEDYEWEEHLKKQKDLING